MVDNDNNLFASGIDQIYFRPIILDTDRFFNYTPKVTPNVHRGSAEPKLIKTRNWKNAEDFVICYNSDKNEQLVASLTDVNGKLVARNESEAQEGLNDLSLHIGQVNSGMYL